MTMKGRYLPKGQLSGNYINALLQPKEEKSTAESKNPFDPYLDLIIRLVRYFNDRSVFGVEHTYI